MTINEIDQPVPVAAHRKAVDNHPARSDGIIKAIEISRHAIFPSKNSQKEADPNWWSAANWQSPR